MAIFTRDFREVGAESFTDFNPNEDVLNFRSVNEGRAPEEFQRGAAETFGGRAREFNDGRIVDAQGPGVSLAEVDGGTMISAGMGNSLFIANVTPDQLGVSNITLDGQAIAVSSDTDFQSILDVIAPAAGENTVGGDGDDKLAGSVGDDTLDGGAGDDVLNSGRGADTLDGGEGNDNLTGGMGDDVLFGGEGDDVLFGDQQDDILDGGAGDDVLRGGAGTDTLHGGEGDDVLDGGARSDTLTGGDGGDTFVQNFSQGGADTITDFNPDEDTIDFGGLAEANIAVEAVDGGTLISGGENTSVFVANVTPDQLGASNITVDGEALTDGSPLGSILSTFEGNNSTIEGEAEDEALAGGTNEDVLANDSDQTGEDTLEGGAGDDTPAFFTQVRGNFDSANTIKTGGEGDDTLEGGMANNTLEGGAGDDTLSGFMGDDYLVGGDGDDMLMGMGSNDVLTGGAGNDNFVQDFRDTGHDIITDFNPSEDRISLNGVQNSFEVSVTAIDGGTLIDSGTGNTLFVANVQPDQLGANNVTINGSTPTFGPNDTLESVLADTAAELQGDTLNLRGFTGSQNFTGGDGDDSLSGGEGRDNLAGGAGDDRLAGGDQNDTLAGGAGDDRLAGGRGNDSLEGGSGDDILAGGHGRDTLAGGAGDDILAGGRGDDNLTGGAGNDTFVKDFGDVNTDTITDFNLAEDVIDLKGFGGAENLSSLSVTEVDGDTLISAGEGNTLIVEGVSPSQLIAQNIKVDGEPLAAEFANSDLGSIIGDLASGDDVTAVDVNLKGSGGDDTIEGGAGDDTLRGGSGDDTLLGGAGDDRLRGDKGDDTLDGGAGDDRLKGGRGDDTLEGGAGDDILKGGKGDDTLEGGAGDDTLVGGRGADTFIQDFSQPGEDTITDFNPNQDVIDFGGLNDFENISISEVDGNTLISAGEGNTLTINNVTPDQLSADNVIINGEAPSADNFNLQNSLSGAASEVAVGGLDALSAALGGDDVSTDGADIGTPTDAALGNALDNAARQGGAPNGGAADTSGGVAAGLDIVADDVQEDDVDEAQADEVAAG